MTVPLIHTKTQELVAVVVVVLNLYSVNIIYIISLLVPIADKEKKLT